MKLVILISTLLFAQLFNRKSQRLGLEIGNSEKTGQQQIDYRDSLAGEYVGVCVHFFKSPKNEKGISITDSTFTDIYTKDPSSPTKMISRTFGSFEIDKTGKANDTNIQHPLTISFKNKSVFFYQGFFTEQAASNSYNFVGKKMDKKAREVLLEKQYVKKNQKKTTKK